MWNQLKTIILLGGLSAALVGFGSLVAPGWAWAFVALALAMNVGAYWFSDRLVLRMHGARELSPAEAPRLHGTVAELAQRAGLPMPRVYLIEDPHANAFATGRNPRHGVVAVTTGLLELLSPRELRGVLAHELAHIKNRDILVSSVAAVLATALTSLANLVQFSALFGGSQSEEEEGGSPLGALALAFVAPIAATLVQMGISRSREFMADETGARLSGDPEALASALARLSRAAERLPGEPQPATASLFIVNPLAGLGSLLRWFSTHPPMEERIERLRRLAREMDQPGRWAA